VDVEFVDFIRADRKFDSTDALVQQMDADVARVRDVLRSVG
jgi:riboflavin kinase/FMN adenylyltransferase